MAQDEPAKANPFRQVPGRLYDKGERRFKHVGKGPDAVIEFSAERPRMWVGKCPSTLTSDDHARLLDEAIAGSNGDRELAFTKTLYAVHDGAIYEAQTTDRGRSYHGYPYRGRLAPSLVAQLRTIAERKACLAAFERWVKRHIEDHGR